MAVANEEWREDPATRQLAINNMALANTHALTALDLLAILESAVGLLNEKDLTTWEVSEVNNANVFLHRLRAGLEARARRTDPAHRDNPTYVGNVAAFCGGKLWEATGG